MRTLRAITDQLNINLGFKGLQKDGYLVLWSSSDSNDALYFFSTGDFQSWYDSDVRSNTARIYFGPAKNSPNNLALDMVLLTPGESPPTPPPFLDYNDVNFAECQADIVTNFEDPCSVLSFYRPTIDIAGDSNDVRRILAQNVGSIKIEWTSDSSFWNDPNHPDAIEWFGVGHDFGDPTFEITGPPYIAFWSPDNPNDWPKALRFTFTLYDSKGILKNGRTFEHIVYIGD